ncbi:MAG: C39 family peptidase [Clostridium sp.]
MKDNVTKLPVKGNRQRKPMSKKMRMRRRRQMLMRRMVSLIIFTIVLFGGGYFIFTAADPGAKMDVPLVCQLPELQNGCEITSLTMLLNYKGVDRDKISLAEEMKKDETQLQRDSNGLIKIWGNPKNGFVGDVTGYEGIGYSVDPDPLIPLINKYYDGGAVNLTGGSIKDIKQNLKEGNPVVAWVTSDFGRVKEYEMWKDSSNNEVQASFKVHAVLLTGYDDTYFYYNDPLNNKKDEIVRLNYFESVWNDMGKKALTMK